MSFDPHYEWLGIPPDEQPADHYRLLGIRRFESSRNVIDFAAERQLLLLKTLQNGPHSELTQQLMNEVSTARICLLDEKKKSEYDAQLRGKRPPEPLLTKHADARMPPNRQPPAELSPLLDELPELDEPWLADPIQSSPLTRHGAGKPSISRRGRGKSRRSVDLSSTGTKLVFLVAGVAAFGLLLTMLWVVFGSGSSETMKNADGRGNVAGSTIIPKTEGTGQAIASISPQATRNTQPPPPPFPNTPPRDPNESKLGQSADKNLTVSPDAVTTAGQDSLSSESALSEGGKREDDNSWDPADSLSGQSRPPRTSGPGTGDGVTDGASPARQLQVNGQDARAGVNGNAVGATRVNQPGASISNGESGNNRAVNSTSESPHSTNVFDGLPTEFDLSAAIAANGPENVLVGVLLSFGAANWHILLEDHSSPPDAARFSIGAVATEGNLLRWPLINLTATGESPPSARSSAEETAEKMLFGHVQVGPTGLFLGFNRSTTPELIEQFTFCSLAIEHDGGRHRIQLQTPEEMPPLTFLLEDSKESYTLDRMPTASTLSSDRIMLEVLRVDMSGVKETTASDLRAKLGKEVTVTLDSELQCELGIKLTESKGQFDIVAMPRYVINDRRQKLVAADIEKDLARLKSQFGKNQKDLIEAQNGLRSLPQEIRRLNRVSPSNAQEAVALQVRIGNLQQMGAKFENKVSRLSEMLPTLAGSIEQMEQVLTFARNMSDRLALHFRVVLQGDTGDLILLETTKVN